MFLASGASQYVCGELLVVDGVSTFVYACLGLYQLMRIRFSFLFLLVTLGMDGSVVVTIITASDRDEEQTGKERGCRCTIHVVWCVMYFWFSPRPFILYPIQRSAAHLVLKLSRVTSVAPSSGCFVISVSQLAGSLSSDTVDGRIACVARRRKARTFGPKGNFQRATLRRLACI